MRELTVARKAVGIDVGSHSVKAVVASKRGDSVAVSSVIEIPLSSSGEAKPEQVIAAVEELGKRLKIGSGLVVTSISTQKTTVRNLEIPFSDEEKARQILKFQTEPYLAFPIEEVIVDFHDTRSASAGKMRVLLTAIHKGVVGDHLQLLSRSGIDPEVVDVDFVAVANTALRAEPGLKDGAAVVLDVGASKTVACYIREGELLAVRCISLGGNDFTEAIGRELGVSADEAEELKIRQAPGDGSDGDVSEKVHQAIASVLDRLGNELDRTVRYFSSQVRGGGFDRLILSGGSASLPGLDKFLGEALSANVFIVSPSEAIKIGDNEELPFPRFATALGLALRGIGETLCLQNFRQEEHAYSRPLRRLRRSLAISGALAVGIVALLVFSLFDSLSRYGARRSRLEFRIRTKLSTIFPDKTGTDLEHMKTLFAEEANKLTPFRELRRNVSVLDLLEDLSNRIPEEMKMEFTLFNYNYLPSSLRQPTTPRRPPRGRVRRAAPAWAGTLTLQGTVSTDAEVFELEKILKQSPYFGEVENKGGTRRDPGTGRTVFHFALAVKESTS